MCGDGEQLKRSQRRDMEVVLEEKDAADWAYKGEGAANLVLAYTGSSLTFSPIKARYKAPKRKTIPSILTRGVWARIQPWQSSPGRSWHGGLMCVVLVLAA